MSNEARRAADKILDCLSDEFRELRQIMVFAEDKYYYQNQIAEIIDGEFAKKKGE
jgi:hypothetical protein